MFTCAFRIACFFSVMCLWFCGNYPAFSREVRGIPPEKPKLVVGIVIEQMRTDQIFRYRDQLAEGGFSRLTDGGTFCRNAGYQYPVNETAVGHATISTGAFPAFHGIIARSWYDGLRDEVVYCVEDENMYTVEGPYPAGRFSPGKLLAGTFADELRISGSFRSRVIGIAADHSAAILSAGHTANAAYWYDGESGKWLTSSYYADSLPDWVRGFNEKNLAASYLDRIWKPLPLPVECPGHLYKDPDNETGIKGRNAFPYDLGKLSTGRKGYRDYSLLMSTPFGNTLTLDFAIATVINEELGSDRHTDYLAIGLNATGEINRLFGAGSPEALDAFLRMDRELAHFFGFLDQEVGLENTLIFLTADSGASYGHGWLNKLGIPAGEFNQDAAVSLLSSYLNIVYGKGTWVKYYHARQIYLNRELIEDSNLDLEDFQERVAMFMIQFEGISNAATAYSLQSGEFTKGILSEMQNGFHQKRSGDVIISLSPGWYEKDPSYSPEDHVPLIWYGWKIKRKVINRLVSMTDIAPTLCTFLNIAFPNTASGEVILEILE